MQCRHCGSALDRPGDYCLVCRTENADAVVLELGRERATVTALRSDAVVGSRTITTTPEDDGGSASGRKRGGDSDEAAVVELRNFAGLVADEVRRKRPEEVYVTGERDVIGAVRRQLHYPFYRVAGDDPVAAAIDRREDPALEVVDAAPFEKLGGAHSSLIGGRTGKRIVETVAGHPHVKKVIPGPIDAGGSDSRTSVRAKATRADQHGNVRLLVREASTIQENRIVTTAGDRELGERVRADLNEALQDADLHG